MDEKKGNMKLKTDNKEKDTQKIVELLFQFYSFYENMKINVNQNLINSKKENYYIINRKWTDKFMEYYDYNKFEEYIQKGNIKEIINNYNKTKTYQFTLDIMKILPNDYIQKIKNKDNYEINKLKNIEYKLKIKKKILMGNTPTYFYTDINIIDYKIYNLIKDIFKIDYEERKDFLFGDNKIIMSFYITNQNSLFIGNYNDFQFIPDIMFDLNSKKYLDYYIQNFISKGYYAIMKNINIQDSLFVLEIEPTKHIGYAYKTNLLYDEQKNNHSKNNSSFSLIILLLKMMEKI